MLNIHTVAAGGGSILNFDGLRLRVGPESAGANPGPASYRRGGPLTVTDCNLMLGRILPEYFPAIFGEKGNLPLDDKLVAKKFQKMACEINSAYNSTRSPEDVAEGFLDIAVDNMANAIKHISIRRGYDVKDYALCCFGGAGGQHACRVADALEMETIFIHPYAGVLSAYGMGLAEQRCLKEFSIEKVFDPKLLPELENICFDLEDEGRAVVSSRNLDDENLRFERRLMLRYEGTSSPLNIQWGAYLQIFSEFEHAHKERFGFLYPEKKLIVEAVLVEAIGGGSRIEEKESDLDDGSPVPERKTELFIGGKRREASVFFKDSLLPGHAIEGPAVIVEAYSTIIVEPGWIAETTSRAHLVMRRSVPLPERKAVGTEANPIMLEIFNNRFMSIAEQMGFVLQNTASSVNIRERLDFSCAIFDANGDLIANAPHIPVHLGAMQDSVKALLEKEGLSIFKDDVFLLNSPYDGGTHLPDLTVITPVFDNEGSELLFFAASRGHHADVGGKRPGSVPPDSVDIREEGILIDCFKLIQTGRFREKDVLALLTSGEWPARNPEQNIADLRAQAAANEKGAAELKKLTRAYSLPVVKAYMKHVCDNAEACVKKRLMELNDGSFKYEMDSGGIALM
jgi:5-oxoprolinase (ATP-hydrolysing)